MAILTDQQLVEATKAVVEDIYVRQGVTANNDTDDIKAALQSIDELMETEPDTLPWDGTKTAEANFSSNLPEPFKSNSTQAQKGLVLAYWVMKRTGVI